MSDLQKITQEQMDAAGVVAAPDVLSGTASENKAIFDRMVRQLVAPAYNAAVDAINAMNQTESGIQAAEADRIAAEQGRVSAEEGRANAEQSRVSAEETRATAEQKRAAAETERVQAESGRGKAEGLRAEAEESRAQAETERASAEQSRESAEEARKAAETAREKAEQARVDATTGIVAQATVQAEEAAASAYQARRYAQGQNAGASISGTSVSAGMTLVIESGGYGSFTVDPLREYSVTVNQESGTFRADEAGKLTAYGVTISSNYIHNGNDYDVTVSLTAADPEAKSGAWDYMETAKAAASAAEDSERNAKAWAEGGSVIMAKAESSGADVTIETVGAKGYAQQAGDSKTAARTAAQEASGSAGQAASSASAAAGSREGAQAAQAAAETAAESAKSWAVGGTGSREGEDTNNAKYWSQQAQAAAGGGVVSFNGRSGVVKPQEGDYTAEQVGAIPQVNGAAGQFLGFTAENVLGAVDAPGGGEDISSRIFSGLGEYIPGGRMRGDIDGDGKISAKDAELCREMIDNPSKFNSTQKECADINQDGKVDEEDLAAIEDMVYNPYQIAFSSSDVSGKWTPNDARTPEGDAYWERANFYIDIEIPGMDYEKSFSVAFSGKEAYQILGIEITSAGIRVYADLIPIEGIEYTILKGRSKIKTSFSVTLDGIGWMPSGDKFEQSVEDRSWPDLTDKIVIASPAPDSLQFAAKAEVFLSAADFHKLKFIASYSPNTITYHISVLGDEYGF